MSRIVEETVYQFDELSDEAKERAREWWRGCENADSDWSTVYDDAARIAALIGINLRQKPVKLMNGSTRYDPCIWFSGFSSQGDGACFEGSYSYAKGAAKKIRDYAPQDAELHRIADELQALQRANFYALRAIATHRGHYYHSGCMSVEVERTDDREMTPGAVDGIKDTLRTFADWIYRQLEKDYEYRMSDENVDESILANEYEFDEHGART